MKNTNLFFILAGILFSTAGLNAHEYAFTLDEAVDSAINNSPVLKGRLIEHRNARIRLAGFWSQFIPQLSAYGAVTRSTPFAGEREITQTNPFAALPGQPTTITTSLEPSHSVDLGVTAGLTMKAGRALEHELLELDRDRISSEYEDDWASLTLSVKKSYWSILTLREIYELDTIHVGFLEESLAQSEERHRNGVLSEEDLIMSRMSLSQARLSLNGDLFTLQSALNDFKLLLGLEPENKLVLSESLSVPDKPVTIAHDKAALLKSNRRLKQLEDSIEYARINKAYSVLEGYSPELSLSARWTTTVDNPFLDNLSLSASLSIPLSQYQPLSVTAVNNRLIKNNMEELNLNREDVLANLKMERDTLTALLSHHWDNLMIFADRREWARENLDLKQYSFDQGVITILELNDAAEMLHEAQTNLIKETANYRFALLDLEYLYGR